MVFKICEGISCSFSVKELDVIVHKKIFSCITLLNFGHSVPHLPNEPGGWGGNLLGIVNRSYCHNDVASLDVVDGNLRGEAGTSLDVAIFYETTTVHVFYSQ